MDLPWLDEIERRAEAATPGPWEAEPEYDMTGSEMGRHCVVHRDNPIIYDADRAEDAAFIAHARTDVPRLCGAVRELVAVLDELVAEVGRSNDDPGNRYISVEDAEEVLERWRRGGNGD